MKKIEIIPSPLIPANYHLNKVFLNRERPKNIRALKIEFSTRLNGNFRVGEPTRKISNL